MFDGMEWVRVLIRDARQKARRARGKAKGGANDVPAPRAPLTTTQSPSASHRCEAAVAASSALSGGRHDQPQAMVTMAAASGNTPADAAT